MGESWFITRRTVPVFSQSRQDFRHVDFVINLSRGIKCVGVPIGSPDFVQQFVANKTSEIIHDVEKVQVVTDPLIHFYAETTLGQGLRGADHKAGTPWTIGLNSFLLH